MLGSNPARDSQVRTGEWTLRAPADSSAGVVFLYPIYLSCHALKTRPATAGSGGWADQAASLSILSSFSLAPFAQPCQRGIVVERPSR